MIIGAFSWEITLICHSLVIPRNVHYKSDFSAECELDSYDQLPFIVFQTDRPFDVAVW